MKKISRREGIGKSFHFPLIEGRGEGEGGEGRGKGAGWCLDCIASSKLPKFILFYSYMCNAASIFL